MEEDKRYRLLAFWIMAIVIVCTVFYFGLYWYLNYLIAKLLQKSEMRKDIVIELSYKGFG
jgi:predicted Na+-dependent transporter